MTTIKWEVKYVIASPRRTSRYQRSSGLTHTSLADARAEVNALITAHQQVLLHIEVIKTTTTSDIEVVFHSEQPMQEGK